MLALNLRKQGVSLVEECGSAQRAHRWGLSAGGADLLPVGRTARPRRSDGAGTRCGASAVRQFSEATRRHRQVAGQSAHGHPVVTATHQQVEGSKPLGRQAGLFDPRENPLGIIRRSDR